jgi:hypothetical protein
MMKHGRINYDYYNNGHNFTILVLIFPLPIPRRARSEQPATPVVLDETTDDGERATMRMELKQCAANEGGPVERDSKVFTVEGEGGGETK